MSDSSAAVRPGVARSLRLAAALACLVVPPSAASEEGPLLLERGPATAPSWAEAPDAQRATTEAAYRAAAADARYLLERLRYRSGELEVSAYLYRPRSARAPLPVVVFNRGSYVRAGFPSDLLVIAHRLAGAGFVVLAPMYRGSDGAAGVDEIGGADLDDLLRVAELVHELPEVDPSSIYLYGESRGGMMVLQALRDGFPARAAAVYGAFSDLGALIASEPERYRPLVEAIWPRFAEEREAILERRSAVRWANRISVPLLVMHGADDSTVPPQQALDLASKLEAAGRDYQLVVWAGARHTLAEVEERRDAESIAWFRRPNGRP